MVSAASTSLSSGKTDRVDVGFGEGEIRQAAVRAIEKESAACIRP
jgi:hypothetical protein